MTTPPEVDAAHRPEPAVPAAELGNEVGPNETGGHAYYDRDGWVVGRSALPVELVRQVRAPIVADLMAEGVIEAVPDNPDRFRWTGTAQDAERNGNGGPITHRYRDIAAYRPVVEHGHARRAVERLWGRPALLWANTALFTKAPARASPSQTMNIGHSDGWQQVGAVPAADHFNLWIPLTDFGPFEGSLAMHAGSHTRRPERYPTVPHGVGPEQVTEQGWWVTGFRVGDAILFRPDIVHCSTVNRGPDLRLAIVVRGQRADAFRAPAAGMSYDRTQPMSTLEALVLALLSVRPLRAWDVGVEFAPRGLIGRFSPLPAPGQLSPRDVVEQALQLLEIRGLIGGESHPDRPGATRYHVTEQGAAVARAWLAEPVDRAEELAELVPAKLALLVALDADPAAFVAAQQDALDRLDATAPGDRLVAAWQAAAVTATRALLTA